MTLIFTICSCNYLPHAKVLGDSLASIHPELKFVIGLVDELPKETIDVEKWIPYELLPVEHLGVPELEDMKSRYNVVELNTAVKPFYIEHFYREYQCVANVIYMDPDIMVLGRLEPLMSLLERHSLVVTPHHCTYNDSDLVITYEISMLGTGIYNLGFLGTARAEATFDFLKWWKKRLINHCYYCLNWGAFVDQQWVILAPLYFDGVYVLKDPGYNLSYWNHFERRITFDGKRYSVNQSHELVVCHFSSYNPLNPDVPANRCPELTCSFSERPDLRPLYDDYGRRLLAAGYEEFKNLSYAFDKQVGSNVCVGAVDKRYSRKAAEIVKTTVRTSVRLVPGCARSYLARAGSFVASCCK